MPIASIILTFTSCLYYIAKNGQNITKNDGFNFILFYIN